MTRDARQARQGPRDGYGRREFLLGAGSAVAAGALGKFANDRRQGRPTEVFIASATSYTSDLRRIIEAGLRELALDRAAFRGKSILLKPNLVEPTRAAPHVNTHPELIRAVAETFRAMDAREVFVAEGQGHVRDSHLVLEQSGLGPILDHEKLEFVDLNHDDVFSVPNRLRRTRLKELLLPRSLQRADLIVSLPKLKTHHWAGVTLAMKNFFGVLPGVCYGWPKNVLHQQGIPESILDIAAAVRPHLAIVDGIIGMEGDGPIMGTPRQASLLIMGRELPAVDATGCRLMDLDPYRIPYLRDCPGWLGPIAASRIAQRGESIATLAQRFELLDHPLFKQFRA